MIGKTKIIAVEGIDASGKATLVSRLTHSLSEMGFVVANTAFPRYHTPIGQLIKQALKQEVSISESALHRLLEADRYDFVDSLNDYVDDIDFLILDRFTLSNLAFGISKGIDFNLLKDMQSKLPVPDMTIILDISAEVSRKRKMGGYQLQELDKHELDSSLLNRARTAYTSLASKLSDIEGEDQVIHLIDANGTPDEVHEAVLGLVKIAFIDKGDN